MGPELALQKPIREPGHHPRPIACAVRGTSSPMVKCVKALHAEPDDAM